MGHRTPSALRSLRVRVPATAIAVFAVSLAVATLLAFQLFLQVGRVDIDVVLDRERERFQRSMESLLAEELAANEVDAETDAGADAATKASDAVREAATRYLALNPANESYWTLIRLDGLDRPLASVNGPDALQELYDRGALPEGTVGQRETIATETGDIRSSSAPIVVSGDQVGSYQIVAPLAPVRSEAFTAAGLVAAAAAVSLLLGAGLLTTTLWRSLSPLLGLARAARSTELRALHARVEVPDTGDEVGLLAAEFNEMLGRLERASASQAEFMASISHELRTPITIARGYLEMLHTIGRDDPDALAETIEVVEDELKRMGRLVEDLMAIARSDMEGFVREREVELVAFFEDLELKLAGLKLGRVGLEPPPPLRVQADPDRLAQAVINLVANASLHTPEGTRIRVRAHEGIDEFVIVVADDGPGIPSAIRDEVFTPFVRASEAPSSTGLGLAVVQAVVDAHGGVVELTTGDQGTVFELHLPHTDPTVEPAPTALSAEVPVTPTAT